MPAEPSIASFTLKNKAKLAPAMRGHYDTFADMHHAVAIDPMRYATLPVYLLGTLGVAYHLANGFWTAGLTLGLTPGERGQRRLQIFAAILFLFLLTLSYGTIYAIYRG